MGILIYFRRNYNVEFFHYIERFPKYSASGIKFNSNERLGWRMYVLYIRQFIRVRVSKLRGAKTFRLAVAHCIPK